MASISIMVTDNENGVINNSFNFSEADIKRIIKALGGIYRPQLELPPLPNPIGEMIPQPYAPSPRDVFGVLSQSLMAHVVNSCHQQEMDEVVEKFSDNFKPIEMKDL